MRGYKAFNSDLTCREFQYNIGETCTLDDQNSTEQGGRYNIGDWNTGKFNVGCFNTLEDPTISMFNKPSDWTLTDWKVSVAREIMLALYIDFGNGQSHWDKLSKEDKATVMSLPNFDADIFEECTGIRVEQNGVNLSKTE